MSFPENPIDLVVATIKSRSESNYTDLTVPRSIRFPLHSHDRILALAQASNVPFSRMLDEVIECGLHEIECRLGEDYLEDICYHQVRSMAAAMKGRKKVSEQ